MIFSQGIRRAIRKGDFKFACELLKQTEAVLQNTPGAIFILGRLYFRVGEYSKALDCFRKVESRFSRQFRYWKFRAKASYSSCDYGDASLSFKKMSDAGSVDEYQQACWAISAYRCGAFQQAFELFDEISDYCDQFFYLRSFRGFADTLANGAKFEPELRMKWPELVVVQGIVQCRQKALLQEEELLTSLLLNSPPGVWGRSFFCGEGSVRGGAPESKAVLGELVAHLEGSLVLNEDWSKRSEVFGLVLARINFSIRKLGQAATLYSQLFQSPEMNFYDYQLAGACCFRAGDLESSKVIFLRQIEWKPDDRHAYFNLALIYDELGELEKALEYAKIQLNIVPRHAGALMWLAEVYIDLDLEILAEQQLVKLVHIKNKNTNRFGLIKKKFEGVFGRPIKPKSTPADFSYIDWSRISVPDEFVLTEDLIDVKPPRKRGENTLKILFRVVGALMLREMTTRFGRNGLGYLWVVIQQIIFISVFALLFEYRGRSLPYGVSMLAFLITGINAFFIFRNTVSQVRNALKSNISLLYYRQVSPFSIYMSRAVLETLTGIFIFGALVGISVVSGEELRMTSVLQVLGILVMLGLFGTCYGLLMATISTFVPSIKHFEQAINRILFFTSGLFYYANELPQGLREILLWNPLLHLIELLRDGFFATYTAEYASLEYVMWWTAGFLFFALILEIVGRKRMLEA